MSMKATRCVAMVYPIGVKLRTRDKNHSFWHHEKNQKQSVQEKEGAARDECNTGHARVPSHFKTGSPRLGTGNRSGQKSTHKRIGCRDAGLNDHLWLLARSRIAPEWAGTSGWTQGGAADPFGHLPPLHGLAGRVALAGVATLHAGP